jgi:hypothetical protein
MAVTADRIGREKDAGNLRQHHPLHDNREEDLAVGEVVANSVKDSPVGKEGDPTAAYLVQQLICPPDIKIRILLPGKGSVGQIFGRRAGANGIAVFRPGLVPGGQNCLTQSGGDRNGQQHPSNHLPHLPNRLHIIHSQRIQAAIQLLSLGTAGHELLEGGRCDTKARWNGKTCPRHLP